MVSNMGPAKRQPVLLRFMSVAIAVPVSFSILFCDGSPMEVRALCDDSLMG